MTRVPIQKAVNRLWDLFNDSKTLNFVTHDGKRLIIHDARLGGDHYPTGAFGYPISVVVDGEGQR